MLTLRAHLTHVRMYVLYKSEEDTVSHERKKDLATERGLSS